MFHQKTVHRMSAELETISFHIIEQESEILVGLIQVEHAILLANIKYLISSAL